MSKGEAGVKPRWGVNGLSGEKFREPQPKKNSKLLCFNATTTFRSNPWILEILRLFTKMRLTVHLAIMVISSIANNLN